MPFSDLSIAAAQILGGSLSVSFFFEGLLEHFGFISITVNAYAWSCRLPAVWLVLFDLLCSWYEPPSRHNLV